MTDNTCPGCGQPAPFAEAVGLCPDCYHKAIRDSASYLTCPDCEHKFLRHTIHLWKDGRERGICPDCGAKLGEAADK